LVTNGGKMKLALCTLLILGGLGLYAGDLKEFKDPVLKKQEEVAPKKNHKYMKKLLSFHESLQELSCKELVEMEKALDEKQQDTDSRNKKLFLLKAEVLVVEKFFDDGCNKDNSTEK